MKTTPVCLSQIRSAGVVFSCCRCRWKAVCCEAIRFCREENLFLFKLELNEYSDCKACWGCNEKKIKI